MVEKLFALFCVLATTNVNSAGEAQKNSPKSLLSQVYVGMLYPSGNMYLKSFFESNKAKLFWAPKVLAYPLKIVNEHSPKIEYRLYPATLLGPVANVYIPGVEGLDDQHNKSCGWKHKAHLKKFAYAPDFFSTIIDHCETEADVSRYTLETKGAGPVIVIAMDASLAPDQFDMQVAETKRPLAAAEKIKIDKIKLAWRTANPKYECSTEAKDLNDAKQLIVVKLSKPGLQLRLSSYEDPGCAGHLSTIWVLDLLKNGQLVDSQSTYHYQGPI